MFDLDAFVSDCRAALGTDQPRRAVRDLLAAAVSHPAAVEAALGGPADGGMRPLYRSAELTVVQVVWRPKMVLMPHEHRMWAAIGVYAGREDNIFWRRRADGRIEAAGAQSLGAGEVLALGPDAIHSVTNPLPRPTAAIHVYGGGFFAAERSEWEPEGLNEQPLDMARVLAMFEGEA